MHEQACEARRGGGRPQWRSWALALALMCASAAAWAQTKLPVKVEITGIQDDELTNVQAFLGLAQAQSKDKLSSIGVHRLYRAAPQQIRQALQPFGYYQPQIDAGLSQSDGQWLAKFHIDPGRATHLTQVTIKVTGPGKDNPGVRKALSDIHLVKGRQLHQPDYGNAKGSLSSAAYAAGYLDAKFTRHELRVEPDKAKAQVDLVLATGPRYYFGNVRIEQHLLAPSFAQRFVQFDPGDPFDTDKLLNLQLALRDSEYFQSVQVNADKQKAKNDHRVPVVVQAKRSKAQKYTFSLGYGTDTGPRAGASVLFRHINRYGHQLHLTAQISGLDSNKQISAIDGALRAQYKIPVEDVAKDFLDFTATVRKQDYGDVNSLLYSLGTSLNDSWLQGRRRLYLKHDREAYSFGDESTQHSYLTIPGISWSRKIADNPLVTKKGFSVVADVHGAAEHVLSDDSFIQSSLNLRAVYPLAKGTRLLLHGEYGATATSDFQGLPPEQRFFTGGARSVRGYAYQELGPKDKNGNVVGGRYLAVGSVELDQLVYGNFGVAAFYDVGNAGDTVFPRLKQGVGIGFRYRSPVGMIRLDFAHPLNEPHRTVRIHVSIGPDL